MSTLPEIARVKPRVIVTTDGEVDDRSSFVRFLLYACDYDIEGLVYTNSVWHPHGEGTTWMAERIDAYEQVLPNLRHHAQGWPEPSALRACLAVGEHVHQGTDGIGDDRSTQGSELIARRLLAPDPRPLWVLAWGGTNVIAQALYGIERFQPEHLQRAIGAIRIYAIAVQEKNDSGDWMRRRYPGLTYLLNGYQFWRCIAYEHDRLNPLAGHPMYSREWIYENVKTGHGPLGSLYMMDYQSEGDSPSFFHLIHTGLRSVEHPSWGGWGGRFRQAGPTFWDDAEDDGDKAKPLWRWMPDMANDFAARMDWCRCEQYNQANHAPVVLLDSAQDMDCRAGQTITLDAHRSHDSGGLPIRFHWWHYAQAGSGEVAPTIVGADEPQCSLTVPTNAAGFVFHIVLEVRNAGRPPLVAYARTVVRVVSG